MDYDYLIYKKLGIEDNFNYEKDFFQIIKDPNAWQQKATPEKIIQMLFDYSHIFNDMIILFLFNIDIVKHFMKLNPDFNMKNIYFVGDTMKKIIYIKNKYPEAHVKYLKLRDPGNLIKTIEEFNMPKHFDVIFTNPPYNNNIDLELLMSLIDNKISNKIICVHPTMFLVNKKGKNPIFDDIKKYEKYCQSIYTFWGNDMFGIDIPGALCISVWDTINPTNEIKMNDTYYSHSKYKMKSFTNFSVMGLLSDELLEENGKINEKIKSGDTFSNKRFVPEKDKTTKKEIPVLGKWFLGIAAVRGQSPTKNGLGVRFYTWMNKSQNYVKTDDYYNDPTVLPNGVFRYIFDTEDEAKNCEATLKTKFMRSRLVDVKSRQNINPGCELMTIPWLDWSKVYTDEDLKNMYNISDELWKNIDNFIDDYYGEEYITTIRGNI